MKIRNKLTLLFTLITGTILFVFISMIYYTSEKSRELEFYKILQKEAVTKANLFFKAKVKAEILHHIYENKRQTLDEAEVAIYDTSFHLLYHDAEKIDFVKETKSMIHDVQKKGLLKFYQMRWQVVGLHYVSDGHDYVVVAAAFDQHGYHKIDNFLKASIIIFIIAMIIIYIVGYFFSKKVFEPVNYMTDRVQQITATNLDLRLSASGNKDELSKLANTFNEMLTRLENSYDAQKNFVFNIAHEIRTPLAAIITELELFQRRLLQESVPMFKDRWQL